MSIIILTFSLYMFMMIYNLNIDFRRCVMGCINWGEVFWLLAFDLLVIVLFAVLTT